MTRMLIANLVALGALAAFLLRQAWPPVGAVRVRNALLLEPSRDGDFLWTPDTVPADFRRELRPASADYLAIVAALDLGGLDDWDRALRLAGHLAEKALDKGPIQADLTATYAGIREGYGHCADFVKVFLALAHAAGLDARQWAFSFDGFGGHGHTFVEVFDHRRGKWLFLDPHNNFHVVDAVSGEPLSALEFRASLLGRRGSVCLQPNGPGRAGYVEDEKALAYFRRGAAEWYLWWGNAPFSYYAHPLVRSAGMVSRALAHLVGDLVGVQPRIHIYPAAESRSSEQRMLRLRRRLQAAMAAALALSLLLVAQSWGAA